MNIEVELRSFISEEKYRELIAFFTKHGEFLNEDYQETYYFDAEQDLRIQKNTFFAKIWLKKGKIHDESREEIEIKVPVEDFEQLEKLFLALGYSVTIKWFRNRHSFNWKGISVAVDYTKGYGYIIELEKMAMEENKDAAVAELKERFAQLTIPITAKEDFKAKYEDYRQNWKTILGVD